MPMPEFTPQEQYLIYSVKSRSSTGWMALSAWGYLMAGGILFGAAAYGQSIAMMAIVFVLVCGFRIFEEISQSKWLPVWRSVVEKYEAALTAADTKALPEK